ncbi:MAG: hypothetical protein VXZ72_01550, partial [Chlamydiota bacterium]|nr:hypothetical protein [Chlamydiota bacterium]
MRDITREILKEWSSNLNSQLNDLRSKRSSVTASSRQKKATEAALRSFGDKQQSIAKIKHY